MENNKYSDFTYSQLEVLRDALNLMLKTTREETGLSHMELHEKFTSYRVNSRLWAEVLGAIKKRELSRHGVLANFLDSLAVFD